MRRVLQVVSVLALMVTIIPSVIFLAGGDIGLLMVKSMMLGATILWFVVAPLAWQHETPKAQKSQVPTDG